MLVDVLGRKTVDCPEIKCTEYGCFTPCEHQSIVYEKQDIKPLIMQAFFIDFANAILATQEQFIEQLCADDDICEQGWQIGFPCFQCAQADYQAGPLIEYGCPDCPSGFIREVTYSNPAWIDLSQGDYLALYTAMVNYLKCIRGHAGGFAVTSFAGSVFGGYLMGIQGETYNVVIPNDPTILSVLPLIESVMPVPFNASVKFYICEV